MITVILRENLISLERMAIFIIMFSSTREEKLQTGKVHGKSETKAEDESVSRNHVTIHGRESETKKKWGL